MRPFVYPWVPDELANGTASQVAMLEIMTGERNGKGLVILIRAEVRR